MHELEVIAIVALAVAALAWWMSRVNPPLPGCFATFSTLSGQEQAENDCHHCVYSTECATVSYPPCVICQHGEFRLTPGSVNMLCDKHSTRKRNVVAMDFGAKESQTVVGEYQGFRLVQVHKPDPMLAHIKVHNNRILMWEEARKALCADPMSRIKTDWYGPMPTTEAVPAGAILVGTDRGTFAAMTEVEASGYVERVTEDLIKFGRPRF